jgi:hypothetical protein
VLWRRRSPYVLPTAVFVVAVPVVYYITHASLRYRHPIDPIVLLLTTVAVTAAWRKEPAAAPQTQAALATSVQAARIGDPTRSA